MKVCISSLIKDSLENLRLTSVSQNSQRELNSANPFQAGHGASYAQGH